MAVCPEAKYPPERLMRRLSCLLYTSIERDGGQHQPHLMRDEDGLLIKILSPSQEELLVEMDENGHIVKLTLPGGCLLYTSRCV